MKYYEAKNLLEYNLINLLIYFFKKLFVIWRLLEVFFLNVKWYESDCGISDHKKRQIIFYFEEDKYFDLLVNNQDAWARV